MKNIKSVKLNKCQVVNSSRRYSIKNTLTGEFVGGIGREHVLEHVPGKKRKQRVWKLKVWQTPYQYYSDIDDINHTMNVIIAAGLGAIFEHCEILAYDVVELRQSSGKIDIKKRKEKLEQEILMQKLKGT